MSSISHMEIRSALQDLHRAGHLSMGERDYLHGVFGAHQDHGGIDHREFKEITKALKTDHKDKLTSFKAQKVLNALKPLMEGGHQMEEHQEHDDHLDKAA